MNHQEVAHKWAHGRAATGNSMTSTPPRLCSYSTCIAELVEESKAGPLALISSTSYSVSTSKHQTYARRALPPRYTELFIPGEYGDQDLSTYIDKAHARRLFDYHIKSAFDSKGSADRARKWKESHLKAAARSLEQAAIVKRVAGLRCKLPNLENLPAAIAKAQKAEAAAKRALAKKQRAAAAARLEELKAELERWKAGEQIYSSLYEFPIDFRLSYDGENVETTRGASFPVADAKRALTFALVHKRTGNTWTPSGLVNLALDSRLLRVGDYTVDRIDAAGIVAGCHSMKWEQIEAFAASQGWL